MRCFWPLLVMDALLILIAPIAKGEGLTLLTPAPSARPHINGPRLYGARPGREFLYRIPCTGARPITFSAPGLPPMLHLDSASGIISGRVPEMKGEYAVELRASNAEGEAKRVFKIVVGDTIGLTPQMGWNDWYTYYDRVTDRDIRTAADTLIASGMADYGYQFISIDDGWATKPDSTDPLLNGLARSASGTILPNKRFPDMAALTASIHAKGLKAGIYTSPGPTTCAKFEGSYRHESADARQFADWGFDLLKYDWCSYDQVSGGRALEQLKAPYVLMGEILKALDRDIIFNICQYGMGEVWNWGADVGANSWRTTGDVGVLGETSLPGFYHAALANSVHDKQAGPGGWNDPDYILIGTIGNARDYTEPAHPTSLTLNEQYSYMSMWALMASPLFFSGDMAQLNKQTLNVLCNSEIIDVDQDPLGRQGKVVRRTKQELILSKPLEDGSVAVGLFNLTRASRTVAISWSKLDVRGSQQVHDLWRQEDLGKFSSGFVVKIPSHGVTMIRATRTSKH